MTLKTITMEMHVKR